MANSLHLRGLGFKIQPIKEVFILPFPHPELALHYHTNQRSYLCPKKDL